MKKVMLFTIVSTLLYACTERMEIDLEEGQERVVIDAMLDNLPGRDSIIVSMSTNFFEATGEVRLSNASVVLEQGGNKIEFKQGISTGAYYSPKDFVVEPGLSYTLNVTVDGVVYSSTQKATTLVPLDSIGFLEDKNPPKFGFPGIEDKEPGDLFYTLYVSFKDPKGEANFYFYEFIENSTREYNDLSQFASYTDDVFFNGEDVKAFPVGAFLLKPTDSLDIMQSTISKESFKVWAAIVEETAFTGSFFDAPPSNIPSTFDNDGLGLFMLKVVDRKKVMVGDYAIEFP